MRAESAPSRKPQVRPATARSGVSATAASPCARSRPFSPGRRWSARIAHEAVPLLLMVLVVFAAHAPFLLGQLPFSTGDDELAQMIAGTSLLERTLAQGDAWSWSYGLGGDVFSEFTYYYSTSPFFYLQMVVKALLSTVGGDVVSVIAWKLAFSIVKMALVMFAMYALLRFERQSRALSVLGAVLYGASPWYVYYELTFSFMTDAMFWLPCVALAFRNYQRGGSWVLLSAAIALTVANNFYFGFESCLFYITLFLAGSYRVCCTRREYLKAAGKALAITAVGLLLAAVAFLPSVGALVAADRSPVDVAYRVFLPFQEALAVPSRLLFVGVKALVPSFCLLAVCLSWKALDTLNRQRTMLAVFWLSALFVPLVGNVMNGMSVGFDRWHYIVAFAVAYAAPGWAASLRAQGRVGIRQGVVALAILLLCYGLGTQAGLVSSSFGKSAVDDGRFLLALQVLGVLLVVAWCMVPRMPVGMRAWRKVAESVLPVVLSASVATMCVGEAILLSPAAVPPTSAAYLSSWLFDADDPFDAGLARRNGDDGFYRIDNVLTNASQNRADNESWLTGEHTTSTYNSLVSRTLHEWVKRDYDIASCWVIPNTYRGFDERYFLEIAWDVRYKTNVEADGLAKWGREPVKPYGAYTEQLDGNGNAVLRNGLSTGFDLWYDTTMDVGKWERLDYAERDAALLQAAVVEGAKGKYPTARLDETTSIRQLGLSDADLVNCEVSERGTLVVHEGASVAFPVVARTDQEGEYLFSFVAKSVTGEGFAMKVNDKSLIKMARDYAWTYDLDEFSFRLPGSTDEIVLSLDPGEYEVGDMRVAFNSYEQVASWVDDRNACDMKDLTIDGGRVGGTIECDAPGILALSMPYDPGWSCWVDGERVPLVKVNGAFVGMELGPGYHVVELRFLPPLLLPGAVVSGATVLVLAAGFVLRKRLDAVGRSLRLYHRGQG